MVKKRGDRFYPAAPSVSAYRLVSLAVGASLERNDSAVSGNRIARHLNAVDERTHVVAIAKHDTSGRVSNDLSDGGVLVDDDVANFGAVFDGDGFHMVITVVLRCKETCVSVEWLASIDFSLLCISTHLNGLIAKHRLCAVCERMIIIFELCWYRPMLVAFHTTKQGLTIFRECCELLFLLRLEQVFLCPAIVCCETSYSVCLLVCRSNHIHAGLSLVDVTP